MISTKKTIEEEKAVISKEFETADGIIKLLERQNKINEIIKFEPSIPILIWKLLHLPNYTIETAPLEPYKAIVGAAEPISITIPHNLNYIAGDKRFVAAQGQQLIIKNIIHDGYFTRNDGLECKTNPSAIETGHWYNMINWMINKLTCRGQIDVINVDPITIYNQLTIINSDWVAEYIAANTIIPDVIIPNVNIVSAPDFKEKVNYRIVSDLPFYTAFNNDFELEVFLNNLDMATQLENDSLDNADDLDNLETNLKSMLEEAYTKFKLNIKSAYKAWVYRRNFDKPMPKTLSAAESKIIKKQMREYIKYVNLNRCEHQIKYEEITQTADLDKKFDLFKKLIAELKQDKSGYWICSHNRNIICSHNVDHIKLQSDNQDEKVINDYISKYTGEVIRGLNYCNICGEEISKTSEMVMKSIYHTNIMTNLVETELTLRKIIWRDAYFTLNILSFAGLYSDTYKQRLANEIAKGILMPVKKQLTPINKIRTATEEQLEARRRFIRHIFIYAFITQLIKNNPKKITFKQSSSITIPTKIGETNFDNILKSALNIFMYKLRSSISKIPNMTKSVVQTILIKSISMIKSGGEELKIKKEKKTSTIHDSAAARYMVNVYNQHHDKKMTHQQLMEFTADYPSNFYKREDDEFYSLMYNYINQDYDIYVYDITIERTEFGYNIDSVLHSKFVELNKKLAKYDEIKYEDENPRNPILRVPRFENYIRYVPRLGTQSLALVYGSKNGFHKHIFSHNEKGVPLSQLSMEEIPKKIVCSICGMTRNESLTAEKNIHEKYEKYYDKQLFYDFIKYYCPESIVTGHDFVKGVCKFCGWDGNYTDKYMNKYYKSYDKFNDHTTYEVSPINIKIEPEPEKKDVKTIEAAKYYNIGLNKNEYENMWRNIGSAENRFFNEIIKDIKPQLNRSAVLNYIYELIILINKIKNYGKYPDSSVDKFAGQKVPDIENLREVLYNEKKYTTNYAANVLITHFNKLGKDAAQYFAAKIMNDLKSAAKPDEKVAAANLLNAEVDIDEPDDEFATFKEEENIFDNFDIDEEELEDDDGALDNYLEN